ncbi:PDZ domain-containing protein [Cellulophaga sp. L1A9]|uniref:PDZ domain-containing protein n=1 Tax=Cellulophaga sp. L1A9 TaxID=2686362 RepID=UPI001E3324B2|nr:PDZ domain-containing protein [Cellulophaga sp. L1A9]
MINNVVIIPIEVNGSSLSFILDSGVSTPILFNLSGQDSIQINDVTEVEIKGLGAAQSILALSSKGNVFTIKNIKNAQQNLFVVLDKDINFSTTFGIPIHGIIGYDLFRDFVVDINYAKKIIKFYDPKQYPSKISKRHQVLPLDIKNKRGYLKCDVFFNDTIQAPVRLLVDTGSSDAIWLFEDREKGIDVPLLNYDDFLGKGLNGNIFGKRTKVDGFRLGTSELHGAKVAFPEMETFNSISNLGDRNGSIGGEVLKRFNIVFNYPKGEIILKENSYFKKPFKYNMSGIALIHAGMRYVADQITDGKGVVKSGEKENSFGDVQILFEGTTRLSLVPEIIISAIRIGSPAHEAGLQEGDLLLSVNGKSVHRYKLQEVLEFLNEREGKKIKLVIERANRDMQLSFVLKKLFK